MSSSGSSSTMMMSASLPASTVPISSPSNSISADHRVAPWMICIGVTPASTKTAISWCRFSPGTREGIGVGARHQASAGVDEHPVEPQRVLEALHLALPGGLVTQAPGPALAVERQRRLPAGRWVVGHETRVRLVEEGPVAGLELRPARRVAAEVGHEGRCQRSIVGHQALDEFPGAAVVHVGVHVQPVARIVRSRRRTGDCGPYTCRMGQIV